MEAVASIFYINNSLNDLKEEKKIVRILHLLPVVCEAFVEGDQDGGVLSHAPNFLAPRAFRSPPGSDEDVIGSPMVVPPVRFREFLSCRLHAVTVLHSLASSL